MTVHTVAASTASNSHMGSCAVDLSKLDAAPDVMLHSTALSTISAGDRTLGEEKLRQIHKPKYLLVWLLQRRDRIDRMERC